MHSFHISKSLVTGIDRWLTLGWQWSSIDVIYRSIKADQQVQLKTKD